MKANVPNHEEDLPPVTNEEEIVKKHDGENDVKEATIKVKKVSLAEKIKQKRLEKMIREGKVPLVSTEMP